MYALNNVNRIDKPGKSRLIYNTNYNDVNIPNEPYILSNSTSQYPTYQIPLSQYGSRRNSYKSPRSQKSLFSQR